MIRINLHDYRYDLRKIEIQKRVVKCAAIIITATLLIIVSWLVEQVRLDSIRSETSKVKSQVAALQNQVKKVRAMEARQNRMETIITGIEGLIEKQMPAGTIVSDLNMAIPEGLWLVSIIQRDTNELRSKKVPVILFDDPAKKKRRKRGKKKVKLPKEFVEVVGYALTEKEVAQYMQSLQKISYYETTFLHKSMQSIIGGQAVYKFTIYCHMPEKEKAA